jgi:hypothetical protein
MLALEELETAKADCLELATSLYATMPHKIHNLVYLYLYDPNRKLPGELRSEPQFAQSSRNHFSHPAIPHWQLKDLGTRVCSRMHRVLLRERRVIFRNAAVA